MMILRIKNIYKYVLSILTLVLVNCQTSEVKFDGNAAFIWLEKQCDFGPRNPGSAGYNKCKNFFIHQLDGFADTTFIQEFEYTELKDNNTYHLSNIIAQYNPNSSKQILLSAHWDTRPWADHDSNPAMRSEPIMGANDGASGVAVLLELARMFSVENPPVGVTIVLFDGEDMGVEGIPDSYAKGSQFFANNLPISKPDFGINLDMIGDKQLTIPIERYSYRVASGIIHELWDLAEKLKLPAFESRLAYEMYDDHVPLWEFAQIPTVDLIDFEYPNQRMNYWHTHNDIPKNCSSESLAQVGTLLAHFIYSQEL